MEFCYREVLRASLLSLLITAAASAQIATLPATFQLRANNGITVPFQNGMPVPTFEKQRRPTIDLGGTWRKQRFTATPSISLGLRDSSGYAALVAEAVNRQTSGYDDTPWATKAIPSVENTLNGIDQRPEDYENGVWYRRSFSLHDSLQGKFARLNFYAVNYVADVWLNGHYLGYHEGGYTPFSFDVTSAVRFDSANVLAVRVDNPSWGSRNDIVPYGTSGATSHKPDWFNFTGIIHDVYLEFSNPISIARAEAIPTSLNGTVEATITLWNKTGSSQNAQVAVEVLEAQFDFATIQTEFAADLLGSSVTSQAMNGLIIPSDSALASHLTLSIPSPKLWSPKHPNLYVLRATLVVGGQAVDQVCTQFGVRTLSKSGNTLVLNGKPMYFPGVARHEDHYLYGRSVPRPVIYSDLQKVVGVNATILRTAHYPNHPYTYLIADRLGLAIIEEIPVWWFDEWDAWFKQDNMRHIHEQMWREMVFRDRNRPSILFWSTCNECLDQTNRKNFIQRLNTELDSLYPDGRFVTESAAADRPGPSDPTQAVCDVAGWTMYFGIFHGSTYYAGTKQFLQDALVAYPSVPFLDTEFGYWSREDLTAAQVQVMVFDSTFAAFNEFVAVDSTGIYHPGRPLAATTWWCMFDWFSIQTSNQTMGLYKMDHSTAKPVMMRLQGVYRPFKMSSENALVGIGGVAVAIPTEYRLEQNYPNPFNPTTVFSFKVPVVSSVRLVVYDLLGREVATLVNERKEPGSYAVKFDAGRLASGAYYYRLFADAYVSTRSMMLVK
jgi:beta-galactosidase